MKLAFRLARRELRGGISGLRIVLACLALGVAAIAAVGTLREGVTRGLAADGSRILGGDIEVEGGAQPLPDTLRDWLRGRGAHISDVVTLRSMLIAASGERELVELKAVDGAWPLIGDVTVTPPAPLATALADDGMLVDPLVLDRLGVHAGDTLRLGSLPVHLRGTVTDEPDRIATPSIFGPRALISQATLSHAGLLAPGSIVEYRLRVVLPPDLTAASATQALRAAFPTQGWRVRGAQDAAPGLGQFIDRTSLFMTLVGLTSLLVGGIGVANGIRAWLEARARGIATLRCLGASADLVFAVVLIQVMALAVLGVVLGAAIGAALPVAASGLLRDVLPVPPILGVFPRPLGLAALYGLLTAAAFSLWPLARAMQIPGAALFRDALQPVRVRLRAGLLAVNALLAAALVALTVATADDPTFAAWFCVAAIATLALFRAGGWAMVRLAAIVPHGGNPAARLGLSNLHRPGNTTALMLVSLGLGLSTLAAVALIEGNLRRQVDEQIPQKAPSFFFIDIQDSQLAQFKAILAATPGVTDVDDVPSLRARILAVKGVPVEQVKTTQDTAWALRGDRGLTYAAATPKGTRLVSGAWWPTDYDGKPLVSIDANIARGWDVHLGDVIRVDVLGRPIDLTVASLRQIDWRGMGLNFTLVASPGLLARAPHTDIATVRAEAADQGALLKAVTDALPNVSGIRVADVLRSVGNLLGQLAAILSATGSLTLAAGALVLAGAVAAGQRRRIRQAVILKSLGATRAQIRRAWLTEFGMLGAGAGLIAAAIGTAASYAVMHYVMQADWSFLPGILATTVLSCIALMLGFGYAGTAAALRVKAAPMLRHD